MPQLFNKFSLSKKTWFSLSLTGLLFATILITQFAAQNTRDNRSQAATTSLVFSVSRPQAYYSVSAAACGTYDGHVYTGNTSNLSVTIGFLSFCGNQGGINWNVRAGSSGNGIFRSGSGTANGDGSFGFIWDWQYDMRLYPSFYASCSSAGGLCQTIHIANDGSGVFSQTFNGLTAGTAYKGDFCAPNCSAGNYQQIGISAGSTSEPQPTVTITANGSSGSITVAYNASVAIYWVGTNATSCSTVSNPAGYTWSGLNTTGTVNLTQTTIFIASCTGGGGTSSPANVTVNVQGQPPAPSVNIKANGSDGPVSISYNTAATLTWTIANSSSCSASASIPAGNWSTGGSNSSGVSTGILTSSKTYSITCGSASDSVTVNVSSPPSCGSNCGGNPPPPPGSPPPSSPPAPPKVVPPSAKPGQQPTAGTDDLKLTFAANPLLYGSMDITLIIYGTPINQTASVSKEGGILVIKAAGLLTKNAVYALKAFSKNSLVQKIGFTYTNNTALNFVAFVTGDFNNDNKIDSNDLDLLVPTGIKSGEGIYDINYDGVVNGVDYSILLINQGKKGN